MSVGQVKAGLRIAWLRARNTLPMTTSIRPQASTM